MSLSFIKKFVLIFATIFILFVFVAGCEVTEDAETGNTIEVDSFINVPGREDEGLVYHKTSKVVYVLEEKIPGTHRSTGFCALYRQDRQFWIYDEESKEIIPEDTEEAISISLTREDYSEILNATNNNTDILDILVEYSQRQEINEQQKKNLVEILEKSDLEEDYKVELLIKVLNM